LGALAWRAWERRERGVLARRYERFEGGGGRGELAGVVNHGDGDGVVRAGQSRQAAAVREGGGDGTAVT